MNDEIQTKLYLRTKDDKEHKQRTEGSITGYVKMYTENQAGDTALSDYDVVTVGQLKNVQSSKLGAWSYGYDGRVRSYQTYYALEREGVTVAFGHVMRRVRNEKNFSRVVMGCFIAAYDQYQLTFEFHLPNGNIWQSTQVVTGITPDNAQQEFERVASKLIGKKGKVRANKRSPEDLGTARPKMIPMELFAKFKRTDSEKLIAVVTALKAGKSGASTAKETGVSLSVVDKIKKELKELGIL